MDDKIDDGGPAFPYTEYDGDGKIYYQHPGVTMRDYFAGLALQGLLSDLPKVLHGLDWQQNVVTASYDLADAMLKARKQ